MHRDCPTAASPCNLSIKVKHPEFYVHFLILKHVLPKSLCMPGTGSQFAIPTASLWNSLREPQGTVRGKLPRVKGWLCRVQAESGTPTSVLPEVSELGRCSGLSGPPGASACQQSQEPELLSEAFLRVELEAICGRPERDSRHVRLGWSEAKVKVEKQTASTLPSSSLPTPCLRPPHSQPPASPLPASSLPTPCLQPPASPLPASGLPTPCLGPPGTLPSTPCAAFSPGHICLSLQ